MDTGTLTLALGAGACAGAAGSLGATILAPRVGLVAKPSGERWHRRATPMLGGLGLVAGLLTALAVGWAGETGTDRRILGLVIGLGLAFVVGLLDDLRAMGVKEKVAGQVVAAAVTVPLADVRVGIGLPPVVEAVLTVVLLVAVMNAVNLLDNMDGVAASAAGLGAIALAVTGGIAGNDDAVVLASALAAGCAGFLVLNLPLPRARLFMGDCGSLPLGLALGAACVVATEGGSGMSGAERLVPLAALFLPALDTVVVLVRRRRMRRPVTLGGRDHLAHRLVLGGMSERMALVTLASLSAAAGLVAATSVQVGVAAGAAVLLGAAFVGLVAVLARVPRPASAYERLRERRAHSS